MGSSSNKMDKIQKKDKGHFDDNYGYDEEVKTSKAKKKKDIDLKNRRQNKRPSM